jgi:hypothetical protein
VKRGVRRLIVKLTLCTLAGAVVTWGVAWGCALWSLRPKELGESVSAPWPRGVPKQWTLTAADWTLKGSAAQSLWFTGSEDFAPEGGVVSMRDYGWPLCSMRHLVVTTGLFPSSVLVNTSSPCPKWLRPSGECTGFPLRILPLGFTLNTLLAAGVLLGVLEGFAFARRRVRRANGRCVACGYDRGGIAKDAACPECGGVA